MRFKQIHSIKEALNYINRYIEREGNEDPVKLAGNITELMAYTGIHELEERYPELKVIVHGLAPKLEMADTGDYGDINELWSDIKFFTKEIETQLEKQKRL